MDKINWPLIFERPKNVEEEKRRGEEKEKEEEEKKKRREEKRKSKKVWITCISCMDTCLWVVGCKKPNPRMNSCMESRVWNPPFEVGFMV